MSTAGEQSDRVRHLLQMLLGIFAAHGVLALDREHLKPAHSVGDLLVQHLDALDAEVEERGGIAQVLAAHFARVYKVPAPRELFSPAVSAKGA